MNIEFNVEQFSKVLKKGYSTEEILVILYLEKEPLTITKLSELLNISDRTVFRVLKKFKNNNYITAKRQGQNVFHYLTEETDELWN